MTRFKDLSAFISSYLDISAHIYHWHISDPYGTNGCIFSSFDMRVSIEKARRVKKKWSIDIKTYCHLHLLLLFYFL